MNASEIFSYAGALAASATAGFFCAASWLHLRARAAPNKLPSSIQLRALQLCWAAAFLGAWSAILPVAASDESQHGRHHLWLVAMMAWVGTLWMLIAAVRAVATWRRYGPLTLSLDPYPGRVGGVVGGWLEMPVQCSLTDRVLVTLKYLRGESREGAEGTERCWDEVWAEQMEAKLVPSELGTRISFWFHAPAHLPASKEDHDEWRVVVDADGPGLKFWHSYDVPVVALSRDAA